MIGEKISIITISYNSKNTIERTFESVLKQSYRPLEYVLIDGGSNDGTVDLINAYIDVFEKEGIEISYVSEKDHGISDAFNKGILRASGTIIGITNSDDCIAEDVLKKVAETFDDRTDVLCGDCVWNDEKNNISYIRKSKIEKLNKLKYEMVLMHPTCYVRKEAYKKYGTFDIELKYVMDKDLMARFYKNGAVFKYIPIVISEMSSGGVSDLNYMKVFEEGVIVAKKNGASNLEAQLHRIYKIFKMKMIKVIRNTYK